MGFRTKKERIESSTNLYIRFVNECRQDRLRGKPLFPMTVEDLCSYIDYKIQHCKYKSMQKHISVLQCHPKHDDHWRKEVYENLTVIKRMIHYRESEVLATRPPSPVPDIEALYAGVNRQVVPKPTRGVMISAVKPPTPSPSRHQQEVKNRGPLALTPEKIVQAKRKIEDTEYLSPTKKKCVYNGSTRMMQINVSELASKVRIYPDVTPILQRPRPVDPPPRNVVVLIGKDPTNC
ncbi:hypothetical protein BDB00DRAFT_877313 [Zychaea mexicana]|uniref:uncharacterized protein n=1 Tax=Zychaea mexicana TaxID=64656 RepID=UPI0022FEB32E|nr:uncharacterized protein BDB00DRAFT_877313 [Zychaea mexicana]KAI9488526.1 hypothetical protein BDB00DRAFT_877313 [Zychaea mexicana]